MQGHQVGVGVDHCLGALHRSLVRVGAPVQDGVTDAFGVHQDCPVVRRQGEEAGGAGDVDGGDTGVSGAWAEVEYFQQKSREQKF